MVAEFRERVICGILEPLTVSVGIKDPKFHVGLIKPQEGVVWKIIKERPLHLLDPAYKDWNGFLLSVIDVMLDAYYEIDNSLTNRTWGEYSTARIQHPLSKAIPILGIWLDMPKDQLPGAPVDIPRIQSPISGASQRMVVSPGREEQGIFHMPGGQSGHPLSAHFRNGHNAWVGGTPTAFLPGATVARLQLYP